MRAKVGDAPRTMSQKILEAHLKEDSGDLDLVQVKVDQVVLSREPNRALGQAVSDGLTESQVEVNVAYPPRCVTMTDEDLDPRAPANVAQDALNLGFLVAQPGAGFASSVHLERFGSPARLALSDDPRLGSTGGCGMLTLPASVGQISEALRTGLAFVRRPRSVSVQLSGRLRPFTSVRDAALDLLRRGLSETVQRLDKETGAPVVLEFGGSSVKFLSVQDRAILCALAPRVGAAAALFPSDEKTDVFLRDQKRSKAYRALAPDPGAPFEEILSIDLAAIDPLVMDERGEIRPVRDFEGQRVTQVLLGGDSGVTLRDFLATAVLLKSKRVPPGLDFLLSPPSRQTLEVLAQVGALTDLIQTGARIIEPDRRVLSGELYPPSREGVALRTSDPEITERGAPGLIGSAETLAFAVATGEMGDPRGFKRPVRVTVPRSLPTDDVLLARGSDVRGGAKGKGRIDKRIVGGSEKPGSEKFSEPPPHGDWQEEMELSLLGERKFSVAPCALLLRNLEDVQWLIENVAEHPELRAVIASHIPAAQVSILADLGVLVLRADADAISILERSGTLKVPKPEGWGQGYIDVDAGNAGRLKLEWLALGAERKWTSSAGS